LFFSSAALIDSLPRAGIAITCQLPGRRCSIRNSPFEPVKLILLSKVLHLDACTNMPTEGRPALA
jgi:hypothetical protein